MPFPFALIRTIVLSVIVSADVTSSVLSAIAFHEAFQVLATFLALLNLLIVIGCLCHQFASRGEETSNTRNVGLFGSCWLLSVALAVALTVHTREDGATGFCNDFAHAGNPCALAGVQLTMAYVSPIFASIGFIASWIDKFPGAIKVTPRYPITEAPSSQFAAYARDLDESYTPPPLNVSSRRRTDSEWSDIPV